jgi:ELWxxDGT repeat protein
MHPFPTLSACVLTLACAAHAQTLTLLKDLAPLGVGERWSSPSGFVELGGRAIFTAYDAATGVELRTSDGTPTGTQLLIDLEPGAESAAPTELRVLGKRVLFLASTRKHGPALWSTDGTAQGTTLLAQFARLEVGRGYGGPFSCVQNGRYYFRAADAQHGIELWSSDGTSQGTRRISDIEAGPGNSSPFALHAFAGQVLFWANSTQYGAEPYITDGTAAGTRLLRDLAPGPQSLWQFPSDFAIDRGRFFFALLPGNPASGLWVSDGTRAGTRQLRSSLPNVQTDSIDAMTLYKGKLYFGAMDATSGYGLWESDGSVQGTRLVLDLDVGATSLESGRISDMWSFGGRLYFVAHTTGEGGEIWQSDGTALGTSIALRLAAGSASFEARYLGENGGSFFFEGDDASRRRALWASDGSVQGTRNLGSLDVKIPALSDERVGFLGSRIVFPADDGVHGLEPWISDGTVAGTRLVANIAGPTQPGDSSPQLLLEHGSLAYLSAIDKLDGIRLWSSDGTSVGTQRLPGLTGGFDTVPAGELLAAGDRLFTVVWDKAHGSELWSYTPIAGLEIVRDLCPGTVGSDPALLGTLGARALFVADDGVHGTELFVSDGSSAGTKLLVDLSPGAASTDFGTSAVTIGSTFWFLANDGLFRSDGTAQGTVRVALPAALQNPISLQSFRERLLILAGDPIQASALWVSDGSASGTQRLTPPGAHVPSSQIFRAATEARFCFTAWSLALGSELWFSDGTPAGTQALDLRPGSASTFVRALVAFGNRFLVAMDDGRTGVEPWITDGTLAGTQQLADLAPGGSSDPEQWYVAGDRSAYFLAKGSATGTQLYHTDGTPQGTRHLLTLPVSNPARSGDFLGQVGGRVLLSYDDPVHGREPFVLLDDRALSAPQGGACGTQTLELRATEPALGKTASYHCYVQGPQQPMLLLFGLASTWPQPWFSRDCSAQFDPSSLFIFDAFVGSATRQLAIPNDPSFAGLRYLTQLVTVSSGPLQLSFSEAWIQKVGR